MNRLKVQNINSEYFVIQYRFGLRPIIVKFDNNTN